MQVFSIDRSDISNTVSNISMRRHKDMLWDMSFSFISNNEFLIGAEPAFVYEQIIQKLESDIRNHIKVENQLKLILGNYKILSMLEFPNNYFYINHFIFRDRSI